MESSTFTIRCPDNMETNWSIQLYPKGAEEDSSDFLSIFLQSETEDIDIDAKCNFSILDVSKIKRNKKVGEWDRYDEVRAYYGFDEFIRIDSLGSKAARLLPNDSLTIVCDVTVLFVPEAKAGADAASKDKEANDGTKTLFDETKAILDETKSKLCLMETKLEELQITTNNNNDVKMKKPRYVAQIILIGSTIQGGICKPDDKGNRETANFLPFYISLYAQVKEEMA